MPFLLAQTVVLEMGDFNHDIGIDAHYHHQQDFNYAPIPAFFNNQMHVTELKAGARLAMRTGNAKYTGVVGKILECEAPHRFSHTFRFTNYDDPECVVTYDLKQVSEGVEFTLTVTDVADGTKTAKNMAQGGNMIVKTLKRVIETGRPWFGIRMLYGFFKLMEPISPKRCRSEHWPLEETQQ